MNRFRSRFWPALLLIACPLALTTAPAFAGKPPKGVAAQMPEIGGLFPQGGQRGAETQVAFTGKHLLGSKVIVAGTDIAVRIAQESPEGDRLTAAFTVAPTARFGPHELRIVNPKGVSNGILFWVDALPNRTLAVCSTDSAPPVPLERAAPVVLNGLLATQAARDRFEFPVEAGETWVFDCCAARMRSRLDPVLELQDESGQTLKRVQSTWESDPRFAFHFVRAGRCILTVRDSEYHGGPNFSYRLLIGRMPFVAGYAPRGGRPGSRVTLTILGENSPSSEREVAIPADAATGAYWTELPMGTVSSGLFPLLVDSCPVEKAPDAEGVTPLPAAPSAVDGVFQRFARSRFSFQGAPDRKYLFDLLGRRIGSRIDGALRVLDSAGRVLAENDDAVGKDARLEFQPPAPGSYVVEARNVEEKTGPDCFYRLWVRHVEPDFQIFLKTDRLALAAGSTIALQVSAERSGGFDGQIEVMVEGLPPTVRCSGGVIDRGRDSVEITLTAPVETSATASEVFVRGRATVAGKQITRTAAGWEQYEHRSIDLVLSVEYSYTRPHYLWDMLLLALIEPSEPVTLSLAETSVSLMPGGRAEIPVRAARRNGADGEIKLEIRGLPPKVTAAIVPIPAKQTEARVVLTAAADAPVGVANLLLTGQIGGTKLLAPALSVAVKK